MLEEISLSGLEDAEVYLFESKSSEGTIDNSRIKGVVFGVKRFLAVRAARDGRIGFYSTTLGDGADLTKVIREAYEKAVKLTKFAERVPWWPGFSSSRCSQPPGIYSEEIASKDVQDVYKIGKEILDLANDDLNVMGYVGFEVVRWAVANTEGGEYEETGTTAEIGVYASRRVNGMLTKSVGDFYVSRNRVPEASEIATKVYEEARKLVLKPRRISGEYSVYFDPRATAELLDFLAQAFYANNVVRGTSPLSGKLGEKVFNERVTISDNPSLPGGPETHACDEEASPSKPQTLVDNGKVTSFLGDLYWGSKVGFVGRGYRGRPTLPPSPSYTNLALHAGEGAEGEVRVAGLTGLHTAVAETGDLSVVFSPAWVEDEHVEAVMNVNVYDLFGPLLEGVDKEGRWIGSIFTPGFSARVKLA